MLPSRRAFGIAIKNIPTPRPREFIPARTACPGQWSTQRGSTVVRRALGYGGAHEAEDEDSLPDIAFGLLRPLAAGQRRWDDEDEYEFRGAALPELGPRRSGGRPT
jgi:hypothetical protein